MRVWKYFDETLSKATVFVVCALLRHVFDENRGENSAQGVCYLKCYIGAVVRRAEARAKTRKNKMDKTVQQ